MIEQMKVETGTKEVQLSSIAQIAAKTQVSFVITPFDPAVFVLRMKWWLEPKLSNEDIESKWYQFKSSSR